LTKKKEACRKTIDADLKNIQTLFNERKSQAYKADSNARTRHFADTQQHVAAMKAR